MQKSTIKKPSVRRKLKFFKYSWGAKIILILGFLFFLAEAIFHIYPFLWAINNSLKTNDEFYSNALAMTSSWQFINYADVFTKFSLSGGQTYFTMLFNSTWQTGIFLLVNILSSTLLSYCLAKFRFPGRNFLYGIMIFTQTIPIIGSGVIGYKINLALGLVNNPYLIWISWAMGFDYSAFILFGFFQGVSNSYMESATLDGANDFQVFFKVIVPQIIPCIVALLVTNFVTMWNDYTTSQIYLNKYPNLAYGLFLFQHNSQYLANSRGVYFAAIILTSIPGVLFYSLTQKLVINNLTVGGLKG